jgi:transposase-like protein
MLVKPCCVAGFSSFNPNAVALPQSAKLLTPEQQKIQELEARINRLEREQNILKKAAALLMFPSPLFTTI